MGWTFQQLLRRTPGILRLEDDLVSEGYLGLCLAARGYNQARGTKFSTYAVRVIRNRMFLFLSRAAPIVRGPRNLRKGLPPAVYYGHDLDQLESPPDEHPYQDELDQLHRELGKLHQRDQFVLRQRFGIGTEVKGLRALGALLGVTGWAITVAQRYALKRLRRRLEKQCTSTEPP